MLVAETEVDAADLRATGLIHAHEVALVVFLENVEDAGVLAVEKQIPTAIAQAFERDAAIVQKNGAGLVQDALPDEVLC